MDSVRIAKLRGGSIPQSSLVKGNNSSVADLSISSLCISSSLIQSMNSVMMPMNSVVL
jgi:hypothetical protein